jgi:hypothetical protein
VVRTSDEKVFPSIETAYGGSTARFFGANDDDM